MRKTKVFTLSLLALICIAGCSTTDTFQLSPTAPNSYWNGGRSLDYNQYEITITCEPVPATIKWNDKTIGTTPLVYKFTGVIDNDERVKVTAVPFDEAYQRQDADLRGNVELPRAMRFQLIKR